MKKVIAILLLLALAVAVTLVLIYMHRQGPIRALAERKGQQRGKAAEILWNRSKKGKLDRAQAEQILEILGPRIQKMAESEKSSWRWPSSHTVYREELRLAWQRVVQELIPKTGSIDLLSNLDSPWWQYISGTPSRLELHGHLKAPPQGTIAYHVLWAAAVDGQPKRQKLLEVFVCGNSPTHASITWGRKKRIDLAPHPSRSLSIEMKTTWYSAPGQLVGQLPVLADKPQEFANARTTISSEAARKLCEHSRSTVLTETDGWKGRF